MRSMRVVIVAAMVLGLVLCARPAAAGTDLNEVGALLVYPLVVSLPEHETLVTITNASPMELVAHLSFIDGFEGTPEHPNPNYCNECDFDIPLTGNDTELVIFRQNDACEPEIIVEDSGARMSCPQTMGMLVVALQDHDGRTRTDNVLLGSQVVVDYRNGYAFSLPAVPFQGKSGGDQDGALRFDDAEYGKLPRIVAADFIAPDPGDVGPVIAELALFTLGFDIGRPPRTDCSVIGYDAAENPFSRSLLFGCWTLTSLWDVHPEFAYPNLGHFPDQRDTHGWVQLSCRVDQDANGSYEVRGGVHGALVQKIYAQRVAREPFSARPSDEVAWGRLLYQSVTTGDAVTLHLPSLGQP